MNSSINASNHFDMQKLFKTLTEQHSQIKHIIDQINITNYQIHDKRLRIALIIEKYIQLLIENMKLRNMINQFNGDFGDDNQLLKDELQAKNELLQLLEAQQNLLLGKQINNIKFDNQDPLSILTDRLTEL